MLFSFSLFSIPILFFFIKLVADNYLSNGMSNLARKLSLSPTIAAVTLIAYANGAPDIICQLVSSEKPQGNYIALGTLFSAFLFSSTVVICNVLRQAKSDI